MEVEVLSLPIFATFGLYALVMVAIGFYFWRKTKSPEQFFLGGRNMGPAVSALSAGASDMSSWLLMGLPGALYVTGVFNAWIAIGLTIGATLNWVFVAKRLRIYTEVISNSITIPDYFETRFSDDKHILRLISAVVILVFFVFYISSGLIAGAKLFEQTFHINYSYALIIGAGVIVTYTFFGGYLAVCWTDLLQGILMMIALIIIPVVMINNIGGVNKSIEYVKQSDVMTLESIKQLQFLSSEINVIKIIDEVKATDTSAMLDTLLRVMQESKKISQLKGIDKHIADITKVVSAQNIDIKLLERKLNSLNKFVSKKQGVNHFSFLEGVTFIGLISTLGWGLGYFGQPHIIVRFMSIRSTKDIPMATFIGIGWMIISLLGACVLGLLGVAYITKYDISFSDPEKIFIVMSQALFNPWVSGILLSALLAAIMSTASSQLLVSASTVAEDFYKKIMKKDATPKQVMFISRASVLLVSLVAFFLSIRENDTILSIVAYAWAGFGASFGTVILFSLFWRRMTRMGAIAGMIVGALSVVVHKNFTYQYLEIYEIIPGALLASLTIIVVSLTQPVRSGTKEAFDKMLEEIKKGRI